MKLRFVAIPLLVLTGACADDRIALEPQASEGAGRNGSLNGGTGGTSGPQPMGGNSGAFTVEPRRWDFGPVDFGGQGSHYFTIRNTGVTPIAELDFMFGGNATPFSVPEKCPLPLLPAASCSILVRFSPSGPDVVNTTLTVTSSDMSFVLTLSGSTAGAPTIALSPGDHAFGDVKLDAGNLPSKQFTVAAMGGLPGAFTGALAVKVPLGFKVEKDACTGRSLPGNGGSCTLLVLPDGQLGLFLGELRITSALGGLAIAKLSINAIGPDSIGLIGYWKFDEGVGSFARDSSNKGNHGTVRQGMSSLAPQHPAPAWEPGKGGGALRIDGIDDWVSVADSNSIDSVVLNNQVSIAAWIKLDGFNTLQPFNVVAERHMLGTRARQFFMGFSNGQPAVGINYFYAVGNVNVPLNTWVHMAMTYDGITQCGFIDGVIYGCQDVGWPLAVDESPFTMGAGITEGEVTEHIVGLIDEVRLYNVYLRPDEINGLHLAK